MTRTTLALLALLASFPAFPDTTAAPADCGIGVYGLPRGEVVDISPSSERTLRWRKFDGTTGALEQGADGAWHGTAGWTKKPDGLKVTFNCAHDTLDFGGARATRVPLDVREGRFDADGTPLAGRLVLPAGRQPVAIAVLVHGSEGDSALQFYAMQRLLPARGVGVFVYDKRGTGSSGGRYTQDFARLSADAVAALHEARRLAGPRARRLGYLGTSQGGWVAPLAAQRERVDFVIVAYGLAVSVIDEDRECVELQMRLKGHSSADIVKALEVATAAETVFESGFTSGFAQFAALRAKYAAEPWYRDLHGNFTFMLLGLQESQLADTARQFEGWNTPLRYDPMPTLRALDTPQLWVLGADDIDAPSAETARRLRGLIDDGRRIAIATFPGAEHGITEYESAADGSRASTRYSAGYFELLRDYARDGRLKRHYGRAHLEGAR
ncbi:MAG TPA: alpha/beta hydrolase [Steroidobacteraceae bacterium]|nr:alpha/beta hydrolase [Steroidobacteraceae bacterium]